MKPTAFALMLRIIVVVVSAGPLLVAQTAVQKPTFEVASIKASTAANSFGQIGRAPGGRFTANNVTLKLLIQNAYRVRDFQVFGGPNWLTADRWNIDAGR